ncbi:hypothetical protein [Aureimonas sp. Leaf454]|uniref:hypothetical protein n=1 Tax=Aureimonas sp. Leaf454 TaxID=1736381 RepID=UPI000B28E7B4|nr:hypothetical protein [Aureimonas sp. Leaf454]
MRSIAALGPCLTAGLVAILLAGCTSVDPTAGISPSADIGGGGRLAPMGGGGGSAAEPIVTASVASASASNATIGPIQFLPVVGAPASTVETLSAALAAEAQRANVAIAPSDGPATPVRLKGYLSAIGEGRDTLVIYVWDVVDLSGNRISRIQGQERAGGVGAADDPWSGVSAAALSAIARRTIGEIAKAGAPA